MSKLTSFQDTFLKNIPGKIGMWALGHGATPVDFNKNMASVILASVMHTLKFVANRHFNGHS